MPDHSSFIPVRIQFIAYHGIALYPFLLLKNKNLVFDQIFINHEQIHFQQQIELYFIPFYFIYLFEYIRNLLYYQNHDRAYREISFEREAFANQHDLDYLTNRQRKSYRKYKS